MMTHLETIATRQTRSRLRTAVFAVCLAVVGVVSIASVQTAVVASQTSHVASVR
jgi:hypothetical protein